MSAASSAVSARRAESEQVGPPIPSEWIKTARRVVAESGGARRSKAETTPEVNAAALVHRPSRRHPADRSTPTAPSPPLSRAWATRAARRARRPAVRTPPRPAFPVRACSARHQRAHRDAVASVPVGLLIRSKDCVLAGAQGGELAGEVGRLRRQRGRRYVAAISDARTRRC